MRIDDELVRDAGVEVFLALRGLFEIDHFGAIRLARQRTILSRVTEGAGNAASWRSEQTYSAAIMIGLKLMPSAFATPAP
jgi:hypothetical protein